MPNVRVKPYDPSATHDLSLTDGTHTWGITLAEGARGIQENPATPSNIRITGGGTKFGDYDPMMSHIEQRDWSGGRGLEYFVDDPTRYYDSLNAWTLTPGKLMQSPMWRMSSGYVADDSYYPSSAAGVNWKPLIRDTRYQSICVAPSTTYADARSVWLWIRKVGTPGTLTFETRSTASTGAGTRPSSAVDNTVTLAASAVSGPESEWHEFEASSNISLSTTAGAGAEKYLTVYGAAADNLSNHWEIGVDSSGTGTQTSSNGSSLTWTAASWKPYYRIKKNLNKNKWHFAQFADPTNLYAVCEYASTATASEIYRCSTTGNPTWTAVTASGVALAGAVCDLTVYDDTALCARGSTVAPFKFKIDSTGTGIIGSTVTSATTAGADRVDTFYDPVDGPQIWKSMGSVVYRAKTTAWASAYTWTPSTGIPVGDTKENVMCLSDYNDQMWVRKNDSVWSVKNDRAAKLNAGVASVVETSTYSPMLAKDLYLYFPWSFSLERLYGGTLDDVGPWKGAGMPSSRSGPISCLESGIGMVFAGINAGTAGYSCVMAYDGRGWHEIYRCQHAGGQVQNLHWQPVSGGRGRLWISVDGDLVYLEFPKNTLNPLRDSSFLYQHEFSLITGTIDMGASQLPKLFHELHVIADGLGTDKQVWVEYQLDDAIGSNDWSPLQWANFSPASVFKINRGDKKAIRFRIRGITNSPTVPTVVNATVLEGIARTPVKRQWTLRAKTSSFQVTRIGLPDSDPDDFYQWFQDAAVTCKPLHMRSKWVAMDDIYVFAEAPSVNREFITPSGEHGDQYIVTIREV